MDTLNALRNHGQGVDDALLQYLSPLGWEHINLTGDYLWRSSAKVGAGKHSTTTGKPGELVQFGMRSEAESWMESRKVFCAGAKINRVSGPAPSP